MNHENNRFEAVVQLLEREDHLTNSRMTWYLTIQGFIIAAVALICKGDFHLLALRKPAVILLSAVCIALSIVVIASVRRARNAKSKVRKKWDVWKDDKVVDPYWFPEPAGDTTWLSFFTPGIWVLLILIVFWFLVIMFVGQAKFDSAGKYTGQVNFEKVEWVSFSIAAVLVTILVSVILVNPKWPHMGQVGSICGVVYDLDGTIIDSTPVHKAAWQAAGDKYKVIITQEFLEYQRGKTNEEAAKYLLEPLGKTSILQHFIDIKVTFANDHAGESVFLYDFTQAYKQLCRLGVPIWVCTASPKQFCLNVYSKYPQFQAFAERTVWREMYTHGKAEGVLIAFENMGVSPQDGVYVGDAPSDWEAAEEAGCCFVCYRGRAIKRHRELLSLFA
jgi:beta-phosphoglucomutase-like phosphatase (HAD superfamily)